MSRKSGGAYSLLAGWGYLLGWPLLFLGFSFASRWVYIPAITLGAMCYFFCMPIVNTQIANVISPSKRAMAYALAVFILHLLGDTAAPVLFGKLDEMVGRESALRYFSFAMLPAAICCFLAVKHAVREEELQKAKGSGMFRIPVL